MPVQGIAEQQSVDPGDGVVSRSTILILSGFLFGLAFGRTLPAAMELHVVCGGGVGLLAYIVLEGISRRRQQQAQRENEARLTRRLESRMKRHIPRVDPLESRLRCYGAERRDPALSKSLTKPLVRRR